MDALQHIAQDCMKKELPALNIGDTVAMLYDGSMIECGAPADFMKSENPLVREFISAQFHTRKAGVL